MLMGFPEPKVDHWADHSLRSWDNVRNTIRESQGMSGEIEREGEGKRDREQKVRERERETEAQRRFPSFQILVFLPVWQNLTGSQLSEEAGKSSLQTPSPTIVEGGCGTER